MPLSLSREASLPFMSNRVAEAARWQETDYAGRSWIENKVRMKRCRQSLQVSLHASVARLTCPDQHHQRC